MTNQITNNEQVQNYIVSMFGKLLEREDVNNMTKKFVIGIINSKQVKKYNISTSKKIQCINK